MSTLLHPEGPESERIYWIRRGIVIAAALVTLGLFIWALSMLFGSGDDAPASAAPATTAASTPDADPTPTQSASGATTAASNTTATATTPASASSSHPSAPASATPTTSTPKPSSPNPNSPCDPARLTITVKGPNRVASGSPMKITTTLATDQGCRLDLTKSPLEVRIYSGNDRIWSTKDCAKDVPKAAQQLHPEQGLVLTQTWPGKRSSGQCKLSGERLGVGTYVVTADLEGARPTQHVFQVT